MRKPYTLKAGVEVRFEADNDPAARRIASNIHEKMLDGPDRASTTIRRVIPTSYSLEEIKPGGKNRLMRHRGAETWWQTVLQVVMVTGGLIGVFYGITEPDEFGLPAFLGGGWILWSYWQRETPREDQDGLG